MDRKKLIQLFRNGMQYPPGKHRFWISRCFEITVREDEVVELDEYEGFAAEEGKTTREGFPAQDGRPAKTRRPARPSEMFHVGRSVVNLRDGGIVEERGAGWRRKGPPKTS